MRDDSLQDNSLQDDSLQDDSFQDNIICKATSYEWKCKEWKDN